MVTDAYEHPYTGWSTHPAAPEHLFYFRNGIIVGAAIVSMGPDARDNRMLYHANVHGHGAWQETGFSSYDREEVKRYVETIVKLEGLK